MDLQPHKTLEQEVLTIVDNLHLSLPEKVDAICKLIREHREDAAARIIQQNPEAFCNATIRRSE